MTHRNYTFTQGAEADLDEIHNNSLRLYGKEQTNKFIIKFKKAAEFAANNIGKITARSHLTGDSGLHLYPVNNFYLAYKPVSNCHIVIIAIFRQTRDAYAVIMANLRAYDADFLEIEEKIKQGKLMVPPKKVRRKTKKL